MKYIIYTRKSSEASDRQVLSIESQENELLALADRNGAKVGKIFRESMSAKQPGRPEFEKLIKLIEQNPCSVLFVWKLDRLARNPVDEGKIKWLLQNKTIAQIITPDRIYNPNDNALIASVEFGMANQYIRDLSSNVKRGNRTKLQKGEMPGAAPIGYLDNPLTKLKTIDALKAPLIKQAFELYATGAYSLKTVGKMIETSGLRSKLGNPLKKAILHHMFTNPFYYGAIRHNGEIYQGVHEPIISKTLFDTVQYVLSGKTRPKKQKHFFPVRGYMLCHSCGCLLTATTKKGHSYYYCTNGKGNCQQHKKYLRDKAVDKLVAKTLNEIKFDTSMIEMAYLAYKEKILNGNDNSQTRKSELSLQLKSEQDKLSNLAKVISSKPTLANSLEAEILSLEVKIKSIEQQIKQTDKQTLQEQLFTLEQTKKAFLQASSASFDYLDSDDYQKFELLKNLLWNLKVENQKVQQYQFKSYYQLMAESPKNLQISGWLGW